MHNLRGGQKHTAMPRFELTHRFIISSSYSIKDIMLQSFYPLAVYGLANDIISSIHTTLGLANHEPKKQIKYNSNLGAPSKIGLQS